MHLDRVAQRVRRQIKIRVAVTDERQHMKPTSTSSPFRLGIKRRDARTSASAFRGNTEWKALAWRLGARRQDNEILRHVELS